MEIISWINLLRSSHFMLPQHLKILLGKKKDALVFVLFFFFFLTWKLIMGDSFSFAVYYKFLTLAHIGQALPD